MIPRWFTCLLLLLAASPASSQAPPAHRTGRERSPANSPTTTIRAMARAYNERSVETLDGLLTADYRFHFSDGDSSGLGYVNGFDRAHELESARSMLEGDPGSQLPMARSIRVTVGEMESGPDPEHPDSLSHYRVVVVHRMNIRILGQGGEKLGSLPADQIFHLVRGDVAQRTERQVASPTRWYVRRWLEDIHAFERTLAATAGRCEEMTARAAVDVTGAFGVRALDSPLCPTLDVVCDLPGSENAVLEVYDVQGRRLARRDLAVAAPGAVRVQAGSGARFAPGAYWLRLTQGRRPASHRMVVVAR